MKCQTVACNSVDKSRMGNVTGDDSNVESNGRNENDERNERKEKSMMIVNFLKKIITFVDGLTDEKTLASLCDLLNDDMKWFVNEQDCKEFLEDMKMQAIAACETFSKEITELICEMKTEEERQNSEVTSILSTCRVEHCTVSNISNISNILNISNISKISKISQIKKMKKHTLFKFKKSSKSSKRSKGAESTKSVKSKTQKR